MSESGLLALLLRYSHPAALVRHAEATHVFPVLRRLEREGFVMRRRDVYRLTSRGKRELAFQRALCRTVVRARA